MGLGPLYIQAGLMLRTPMLHAVLLSNAEAWLRLTSNEIKMLERVDEMLLRKLLKTPISTPRAALYLETGAIPLHLVIKSKRIMFLHHILTRKRDALIAQVLWAQIESPSEGDWYLVVMEDIEALGLSETLTIDSISQLHKEKLKNIVRKGVHSAAFQEMMVRKESLSKITPLEYDSLQIQSYLTVNNVPTRLKQLQFKWRTRMVKVGWNFGAKEKCPLCQKADDDQNHLLVCEKLDVIRTEHYESDTEPSFFREVEKRIRKREILLTHEKTQNTIQTI